MKIGIIGAGKVGCSMGKYLVEHGISVEGYYSLKKESVDSAATFTGSRPYYVLHDLVSVSDILFITTPDDCISGVWEQIRNQLIQNKIICHFSGSLSSVVFSDCGQTGASACSIHPMYAFSDKFTSYKNLKQAIFTMEGDREALDTMRPLFESMGNTVCVIKSENKRKYHAAASMVSNMMIGLYQMGIQMLGECGFDELSARRLIGPLVRGNVEKLLETSVEEALTGPIERADADTVRKHLEVLSESERAVYVNLGKMLIGIASQKNPDRDYTAISNILMSDE